MRIMLISSVVTHSAQSNPEWTAENDVGDFPPIGLMYLAGYLRKYSPHHEIKILDANLLRYNQEDIGRDIEEFKPDLVGMTIYTDILYDCRETMRVVKDFSKNTIMVVGGAHATYRPEDTMLIPEVDYACIGEGELIFNELIDALEGKGNISKIKGLLYRDKNGKLVRNEGFGYIKDLDSLPHPVFDLLPFSKYYSMIGTGAPTGVLCSSRGCPHSCTYCSKMYNNYRARSTASVIEEMNLYYKQGIKEFMFFDDMFNITSVRAIEISKAIAGNFPDIEWSFRGRADQITPELAVELRKSNCRQVSVGAEAHKDEIQEELKTGKKVALIKKAVRILRKNDIRINTNWIIGLPQHKGAQDIEELLKVIFDIDPDYVQFSILMLWGDTELFKEAVSKKVIRADVWDNYIKNPIPNFRIPCWEEHIPIKEQSRLLRYCYTRFYLRPKVFFRQLTNIRKGSMLKLKIKGLMIILIPFFYPLIKLFKPDMSKRKNLHRL